MRAPNPYAAARSPTTKPRPRNECGETQDPEPGEERAETGTGAGAADHQPTEDHGGRHVAERGENHDGAEHREGPERDPKQGGDGRDTDDGGEDAD